MSGSQGVDGRGAGFAQALFRAANTWQEAGTSCPDTGTARLPCCKRVQRSQGQPRVCAFLSQGAEEALAPYSLSRRVWTGHPTSLDGWRKGRVGGGQWGGEGRVGRP